MRRLLDNQTELSIASFWFYTAGGLFSVLSGTVFTAVNHQSVLTQIVIPVAACSLAVLVFVLGYRFAVVSAAVLMAATGGVLLYLVMNTPLELQAVNIGMLFTAVVVYLVWFTPIWFARVVSGVWIVLYVTVMAVKHGESVYPVLVTFLVTMVVLGELLHRFKTNLEERSLTDPLAGTWNKRGFDHLLAEGMRLARRTDQKLSVIYIDIDELKSVNDSEGHRAGDRYLVTFARNIRLHTRAGDVFGRLGGDEFAIMTQDADAALAIEVGERLRRLVTCAQWSYGVAELREGDAPSDLIERADAAMFAEKQFRKQRSEATA